MADLELVGINRSSARACRGCRNPASVVVGVIPLTSAVGPVEAGRYVPWCSGCLSSFDLAAIADHIEDRTRLRVLTS